jgi:hypothetical protein
MGLNIADQNRSFSAPVEKPLQTGEDEDSSSDDESDSTLSVASAGDMKSNSPHGSVHEGKGLTLPTDAKSSCIHCVLHTKKQIFTRGDNPHTFL